MLKKNLFLLIFVFKFTEISSVGLDPSFNPNSQFSPTQPGTVVTNLSNSPNSTLYQALSIALQTINSQSQIVVSGTRFTAPSINPDGFAFARYNANGSLDTTLNPNSTISTSTIPGTIVQTSPQGLDQAFDMGIDSNQKIVMGGFNNHQLSFEIMRFNIDGSLDTSFNSAGTISTMPGIFQTDTTFFSFVQGLAIALNSDNSIIEGGLSADAATSTIISLTLLKANSDGTIDTAFGNGRVAGGGFTIVSPSDLGLSNINFTLEADDIVLSSVGQILAVGTIFGQTTSTILLGRFNADGSPDTTFSSTAGVINTGLNASGTALTTQSDGKIVVVGSTPTSHFLVARFLPNGQPDTSFAGTGSFVDTFSSNEDIPSDVFVDNQGNILVVGVTNFIPPTSTTDGQGVMTVVRYTSNGSRDASFGNNGVFTIPFNGFVRSLGTSLALDNIFVSGFVGNARPTNIFAVAKIKTSTFVTITSPTLVTKPGPFTITGTTDPGNTVIVSIDGKLVGTVTANANGNYSITSQQLPNGQHVITAVANDAEANTALATHTFTVDIGAECTEPADELTLKLRVKYPALT